MKKLKYLISILLSILFARFIYTQNNSLEVSNYEYTSLKIPKVFDGYKIVQISDLHDKLFGKANKKLIQKIDEQNPDIIVITGDVYYSYKDKIQNSLDFLEKISKKYTVYFVTGNHEQRDENWISHKNILVSYGIKILDNTLDKIYIGDQYIQISGLKDPSFYIKSVRYKVFEEELKNIASKREGSSICILLSHRPERFNLYEKYEIDLVFCGHAHGGQVRVFGKGLLSPSEGFFPRYTGGEYKQNSTTMILSRGLGRTIFTTRLFNKPDIVSLTLRNI